MIQAAKRWFRSTVDVRPGEGRVLALMVVYGLFAMTSYYIVKPVRNSVFVARVGADQLPFIYILTALFVIALVVLYSRGVDRVKRLKLLLSSLGVLGVILIGFWWLLRGESGFWTSGAFYIFGKLYPLILISQFWLVANLLFSSAQARRLFGLIGLGPIVGGVAGSAIAGGMAQTVGTQNLLLIAVGMLGLCAVLIWALAGDLERGSGKSGRLAEDVSGGAVALLLRSDHLKTIAAILALTIVVGTMLDWQFNRAVELFIEGEDAKTRFFGIFFGALNVTSLLVQLFFTGWILRRFGIQVALLALPVGLLVGTIGIVAAPVLLTVALAKGAEGALRYSLDQATRELLFLPVPTPVTLKVKPLIDLGIYRGGTGIAGVLLLIVVNGLGFSIQHVALLTGVLIGAWIWVALGMRREFANSMRRLIDVRDVKLEDLIVGHLGAETLAQLRETLHGGTAEQISYALTLLRHAPSPDFADDIADLLEHESPGVRRRAVAILADIGVEGFASRVEPRLGDTDLDVRAEAVRYMCEHGSDDPAATMLAFLEDASSVRTAAVSCLMRYGGGAQKQMADDAVRELANSTEIADRRVAAQLLGRLEDMPPHLVGVLRALIEDDATVVSQEAIRAAGAARVVDMLPELSNRLADPRYRQAAASALRAFGSSAHGQLMDLLEEPSTARSVRAIIPRVLGSGLGQKSVNRLLTVLEEERDKPVVRFEILKALNKARRARRELSFEAFDPEPLVRAEVEEAYRFVLLRARHEGRGLLRRTLLQRQREAIERAFRALALAFPPEDVYAAHEALSSRSSARRQQGFELLETVLPLRYRRLFDPLLNPGARPERVEEEARDWASRAGGEEESVRPYEFRDPWLDTLVACASDREEHHLTTWRSLDDLGDYMRATSVLAEKTVIPSDEDAVMEIVKRAEYFAIAKMFENVRTEDLAGIATLAEEQDFEDGEVVFEVGERGRVLYLVTEGRIEASRDGRLLFTAQPGRSVGNLSFLDGLPTNYRAVAVGPTRTLTVSRESFSTVLEERARVAESVIAYLSGVVRGINESPDSTAGEDHQGAG